MDFFFCRFVAKHLKKRAKLTNPTYITSLTMSSQEAPEPCAAASEIGSEDEEVGADQNEEEPAKRRKLPGLTQFEDEFAVRLFVRRRTKVISKGCVQ